MTRDFLRGHEAATYVVTVGLFWAANTVATDQNAWPTAGWVVTGIGPA